MATFRTTVPKTSINEHGNLIFVKKEIRFTSQVFNISTPSLDSGPHKSHSKTKFGGPIVFAPDGRHCL
jgi:hypothetical protein